MLTVKSGIIGGDSVITIGKLDIQKFKAFRPMLTDEVIVTQRQLEHIQERHPKDFARYQSLIADIIRDPDWIMEDAKNPSTCLLFRRFVFLEQSIKKAILQVVLRIHVAGDDQTFKNSVISMWEISERRLETYLRNGKMLYKRE